MLLDAQCLFSDNQSLTSGTIYSTNVVKFGVGDISYLPLIIQATEDFEGLTSLKATIQTSATADFSTSDNLVEANLDLADLKAGALFPISYLPKGNKGYMRICYTITGTATAGKITAGVVSAHETKYEN